MPIDDTDIQIAKVETLLQEVLRRLDGFDKNIVPRHEYSTTVDELRRQHADNQVEIAKLHAKFQAQQDQIVGLIWKVASGLGVLQVVLSIVLYLLTQGNV